jgi:hypothetical protein
MEYYDKGIKNIQNLPGMQGPMNLGGAFGTSANGMFGFNQQMGGANMGIGNSLGQLLGGGGFNQFGNLDLQGLLSQADQGLQQQIGPMNQVSAGGAQQLFNQGIGNLGAANNWQGMYSDQLGIMRDMYAPQRQVEQNQMFDALYSKGLIGSRTATQGSNNIIDRFFDRQNQMDMGFQNTAFDRATAEATRRGNLGLAQTQQGFGAENQAFMQALSALTQNQDAGLKRLGAAQGLFGLGQDAYAQNYGLGLQGAETLLGYGNFGLNAAAMPYQLQAGLLGSSGMHAQALGNIAIDQANSSAGFMGGLFG